MSKNPLRKYRSAGAGEDANSVADSTINPAGNAAGAGGNAPVNSPLKGNSFGGADSTAKSPEKKWEEQREIPDDSSSDSEVEKTEDEDFVEETGGKTPAKRPSVGNATKAGKDEKSTLPEGSTKKNFRIPRLWAEEENPLRLLRPLSPDTVSKSAKLTWTEPTIPTIDLRSLKNLGEFRTDEEIRDRRDEIEAQMIARNKRFDEFNFARSMYLLDKLRQGPHGVICDNLAQYQIVKEIIDHQRTALQRAAREQSQIKRFGQYYRSYHEKPDKSDVEDDLGLPDPWTMGWDDQNVGRTVRTDRNTGRTGQPDRNTGRTGQTDQNAGRTGQTDLNVDRTGKTDRDTGRTGKPDPNERIFFDPYDEDLHDDASEDQQSQAEDNNVRGDAGEKETSFRNSGNKSEEVLNQSSRNSGKKRDGQNFCSGGRYRPLRFYQTPSLNTTC